uniref:RING-type E3 ubiquitin transferase n=1 Tax=Manihot esculenta TaxID=3983 RepID=A0A2C9VCA8_MANES
MARTCGMLEAIHTAAAAASTVAAVPNSTELKMELQSLMNQILDGEDHSLEITVEVLKILTALEELKKKSSDSLKVIDDNAIVPDEFKCPISRELMADPVVLATGQTYDRAFILRWLNDGHRTCPQTRQVLSHTILTPNHLVREMISHWCEKHGVEVPRLISDVEDNVVGDADRDYLNSLLEKMYSSLSDQKKAAKELRLLTKRMPSFRALFALKSGTMETRSNAAAALFSLSTLDSNKILIGKSGALKALIDLLEEGHLLVMKDAASAIFNLCIVPDNKARAVHDGAVRVILKKIMENVLVDELLAILAMLASHQKAVEETRELGAVSCLLSIIRRGTSERNKEYCAAILHTVCLNDRTTWREFKDEENGNHTLSKLAVNGNSRARRKAKGILERLVSADIIIHNAR